MKNYINIQIWDTAAGEEVFTLEGHKNVVYCIAFNNPFGYSILLKYNLAVIIESFNL